MNVTKECKILQIIAAQAGWKAVYCGESPRKQVKLSNCPVICWALVETVGAPNGVRTEVRGVVQESNRLTIVGGSTAADRFADDDSIEKQYFLGYNDPEAHKESDYWINQAHTRLKLEQGNRAGAID